ncbi:MAG: hypothetical protein IKR05_14635 [Prevotella sp.]|nr:hypothetical protein [Prevotella sp.]
MKTKQTIKELMTSTAWGQSGASVRRAAITLLVMVLTATGAWAENIETVSYIDAYGNVQTAQAVALDGNETITEKYGRRFIDLAEGWYFVGTDITYSDVTIRPLGNVNLILANGCTMNIGTADSPTGSTGIYRGELNITLTIYGQSLDPSVAGTLSYVGTSDCINMPYYTQHSGNVSISNTSYTGLNGLVASSVTLLGGTLTIATESKNAIAISARNDITISGGTLSATATGSDGDIHGLYSSNGTITLGWTNPADRITASSYSASTVKVADGQVLTDGSGHFYSGTLSAADISAIAGQTLCPYSSNDFSVNDAGTEYTIHTATGWDFFCNLLEGGETFLDKTVYLGASIEVSRMADDGEHGFAGTFDGQNNTLTFNYGTAESPADEQFVAPFSFTVSGTSPVFRDLIIDGDIYATHTEPTINDHAGGLIAHLFGTVTIDNCVSNVRITTTGEDGAGGFVGLCEHSVKFTNCKSSAVVTSDGGNNSGFVGWSRSSEYLISFDGCLFNGKLLMKDNNGGYNGGFVGWKGDAKTVTIDNCLYIPADTVSGEKLANTGSANFCRQHDDKSPAVINNCYYISSITQYYGAVQGIAPLSVTAGENVTIEAVSPVGDATKTYSVSGITAYAQGITCDGTFYYGSGDKVSLTLSHGDAPEGYAFADYTASPEGATLTGTSNPYTLTMPDSNVQIGAKFAIPIPYIDENGEKQTCSNYTIISNDMTSIGIADKETWYVVEGDITFNQRIEAKGNVHLILADDAILTIDGKGYRGIHGGGDLIIYGQDKGNGNLIVKGEFGIYIPSGNLTINGGEIDADGRYDGIYIINGNLTINGGKVDVDGRENGIYVSNGTVTFGWTRPEDHIYSNSYDINGNVIIASGQTFTDGTNFYTGNNINANALNGKTLFGGDVIDDASDIASLNGKNTNVLLSGRKLKLDDSWNTLCLPFDVDNFDGTPLEGFTVKEIDTDAEIDGQKTGFKNGTLCLNFKDATSIKAGKPYIVKSESTPNTPTYTATDGSGEYWRLMDGEYDIPWIASYSDINSDGLWFCEFTADRIVRVTGYTVTGGEFLEDNPHKWTLKAKLNPDDEWTTIHTEYDTSFGSSFESKSYEIDPDLQGRYKYFRFEVSNCNYGTMALGELALQVEEEETGDLFFKGVTINSAAPAAVASEDEAVTFTGCYSPVSLSANDKSKLFMGAEDELYYPNDAMSIGAFRAYFQLANWLVNADLGDVNDDGKISVSDAMTLVNIVLGEEVEIDNVTMEKADINGDGNISVSDVMAVVNIILNGRDTINNIVVNTGDITNTYDSIGGGTGPARTNYKR